MVHNCIVTGCRYRKRKNIVKGIVFHSFPVDPTRLAKWQAAIATHCPKPINITKHSKICQFHFLDSDYVQTNHGSNQNLLNGSSNQNSATITNNSSYRRNTRHLKTTAVPSVFNVWTENGSPPPAVSLSSVKSEPRYPSIAVNQSSYNTDGGANTTKGDVTSNSTNSQLFIGVKSDCNLTPAEEYDRLRCTKDQHDTYSQCHQANPYSVNEILSTVNYNQSNPSNSIIWKNQPASAIVHNPSIMSSSNFHLPVNLLHQHTNAYPPQLSTQNLFLSQQSATSDHINMHRGIEAFQKRFVDTCGQPICNSYGNRFMSNFNPAHQINSLNNYVEINDIQHFQESERLAKLKYDGVDHCIKLPDQSDSTMFTHGRKRKNLLDTIDSLYRKNQCIQDDCGNKRQHITITELNNSATDENITQYGRHSNSLQSQLHGRIERHDTESAAITEAILNLDRGVGDHSEIRSQHEFQIYYLLSKANLLHYYNSLIAAGGDDIVQLCQLSKEEFKELVHLIGMTSKPFHVKRFKKVLSKLRLKLRLTRSYGSDISEDETQDRTIELQSKILSGISSQLSSSASTPAVGYISTDNNNKVESMTNAKDHSTHFPKPTQFDENQTVINENRKDHIIACEDSLNYLIEQTNITHGLYDNDHFDEDNDDNDHCEISRSKSNQSDKTLCTEKYYVEYQANENISSDENYAVASIIPSMDELLPDSNACEEVINNQSVDYSVDNANECIYNEHTIDQLIRSDVDEVNHDGVFTNYYIIARQIKENKLCDNILIDIIKSILPREDLHNVTSYESIIKASLQLCKKHASLLTRKHDLLKLSKELSGQLSTTLQETKRDLTENLIQRDFGKTGNANDDSFSDSVHGSEIREISFSSNHCGSSDSLAPSLLVTAKSNQTFSG